MERGPAASSTIPQEDAVALQGDLTSFALPDVLRLLAGAGKSGNLEVAGTTATGEILLRLGTIAAASTSAAPRAHDPADVLFELLRIEEGSFSFDEGEVVDGGLDADVEATIASAEALVGEWTEIEAVVPSMDAWVSLVAEVDADEVIVSAARWRAIAAVGSGGTIHDLAAALELSDLDASRVAVELVTDGLALVRTTPGYRPARIEAEDVDGFDPFDDAPIDPMTDLHDLSAEDRPVVMEDSDDALLPEPLPGEGVAYEGEPITGSVDGHTFEAPEDAASGPFEPFDSLASFEEAAAMSERIGEPGTIEGFGGADPFAPADPYGFGAGTSADDPGPTELVEVPEAPEGSVDVPEEPAPVDAERDSLLKFLSSVKP
jgi:hypothetical protein